MPKSQTEYSLFDKQQVAEHFHVRYTADNVGIIAPNYNVAPGDPQPVIRRNRDTGERELVLLRWGLIPFWAKDAKMGLSTINAKAETVATAPAFREAFKTRRCLVLADAFYEWQKIDEDEAAVCNRHEGRGHRMPSPACGSAGEIPRPGNRSRRSR